MKCLNLVIGATMCMFLANCASTPVKPADAKSVDAKYLYSNTKRTSEMDAMITVVRDQGMISGGCRLGFYINGELSGDFDPAEKATFYLPPDEYRIGVGAPEDRRGLCAIGVTQLRQRETTLKAHQAKRYRISVESSGLFDILPY